jgi:hypothetical protein
MPVVSLFRACLRFQFILKHDPTAPFTPFSASAMDHILTSLWGSANNISPLP